MGQKWAKADAKKRLARCQPSDESGSPTWTRTRDLRINSPSLYQLSYRGSEQLIILAFSDHPGQT